MPLKTHIDEQPTLNLTPMIDIVFLLIIFFMVGTKFTEMERKIPLEVPAVSDSGALSAEPERKVVNVYRNGQVQLDREFVTLEELTTRLSAARSQYKGLGVLIRGDDQNTWGTITKVLVACQKSGISKLGTAVTILNDEL